jgi:hypothetical protein
MIYFFIFFSLGPELETGQASQPLTPPCPPNLAWKDKEWMKVGFKRKCKVGTCIITYCAKWLLTKHLKEVHGLVIKKAKLGKPSTSKGSPQHHDHVKMNVCILGDAMAVQRQNDQKIVSHACAKAQHEWDKLVIIAKLCPPLLKPTSFKLVLK